MLQLPPAWLSRNFDAAAADAARFARACMPACNNSTRLVHRCRNSSHHVIPTPVDQPCVPGAISLRNLTQSHRCISATSEYAKDVDCAGAFHGGRAGRLQRQRADQREWPMVAAPQLPGARPGCSDLAGDAGVCSPPQAGDPAGEAPSHLRCALTQHSGSLRELRPGDGLGSPPSARFTLLWAPPLDKLCSECSIRANPHEAICLHSMHLYAVSEMPRVCVGPLKTYIAMAKCQTGSKTMGFMGISMPASVDNFTLTIEKDTSRIVKKLAVPNSRERY